MLQKAGGLFQLLAEVDFGTGYGIKSLYYKTRTSNIADAGQFRLARADVINWRNEANSANLSLGVSSTNVLQFNGVNILPETLASGQIWVGNVSNVATAVAMSGDGTLSNTGALTIAADAVSNAKLAEMATLTIKGNSTGGTANPSDLSVTTVTSMLNAFVGDSGAGGTKGLVPAPASGDAATRFLKADGTWAIPSGAGDVVGPASATDNGFVRFDGTTGKLIKNSAATISNADVATGAAIAYTKLAALASANILVGNASNEATVTAVTGDISISNTGVTAYAGTVPLNKGGTGQTTKAPAFDALSPMTTGGDIIYGGASGTGTRLANGSANQVLMSAGGTSAPVWANPIQTVTFNETQTSGTNGGTFTSGAWRDRTLNTTINSQSWASISSNEITLNAGTYYVEASAPANFCNAHKVKWRNTTDSTDTLIGTSEFTSQTDTGGRQTRSFVEGIFTIAGTKAFKLQHQCGTTQATNGFGVASSFSVSEIYAIVNITRLL